MKLTRVNEILFARQITHTAMGRLISRRFGRPCSRQQVSMVARGQRYTPWLQDAIAAILDMEGPELFGGWWYEGRER